MNNQIESESEEHARCEGAGGILRNQSSPSIPTQGGREITLVIILQARFRDIIAKMTTNGVLAHHSWRRNKKTCGAVDFWQVDMPARIN